MKHLITGLSKPHVHLLMLVLVALVASSFPLAAAITHALPPEVAMCLRFALAALIFIPIVYSRYPLELPGYRALCRYALLSLPLVTFFWCMFESLRYTSAVSTAALYTSVPAMTAVYAVFLNRETVGRKRLLGLCLGMLASLWIVFRGDFQALLSLAFNRGDWIFLAGCLAMAIYNPMLKRLYRGEPTELMTFWVLLLGAGFLFLLSASQITEVSWTSVPAKAYWGLLYLAIFTTMVTFFIQQYATLQIGATQSISYSYLTPLFVLLLGLMMGDEVWQWRLLPAVLLLLAAMWLIQRDAKDTTSDDRAIQRT